MDDMERAKIIAENSEGLSQEARSAGIMGALMGVDNEKLIHGMVSVQDSVSSKEATTKTKKPRKPRGMTDTESVLYDMLTEDCGVAMMDSGGEGGRSWQKNRAVKDFRDLLPINYEYETWTHQDGTEGNWFTITRLLFHHLNEHLTYDKEETKKLEKWLKKNDRCTNSTGDVEEYIEQVYGGEEDDAYHSGNTYNGEDLLSQGFSYVEYGAQIFISIHGGADIRGGYGDYKVFTQDEHDMLWLDATHCYMKCSCGSIHSDDSGYHWYNDSGQWDDTSEGFPKCWKEDQRATKKLRCSECGDIVEVE